MVRNRDVIVNADYIKDLAASLASSPPSLEVAKLIIGNEFDNLNSLFQKFTTSIVYHRIVRARIEYLLFAMQHLISQIIETSEISQIRDILQNLYKLLQIAYTFYHQYSEDCASEQTPLAVYDEAFVPQSTSDQTDEDLQNLTQAPEGSTSWLELCITSLCTLLIRSMIQNPSLRKMIIVSTSESFQLLSSRLPILQTFSLHLILASLQLELEQLVKPKATQTSSIEVKKEKDKADRKGVMRRSSSEVGGLEKASSVTNLKTKEASKVALNRRSRSVYVTNQNSGHGLEESFYLIHNGGLRTLLWCLLHTLYEVRLVSMQVLRTLCAILHFVSSSMLDPVENLEKNQQSGILSVTSLNELWTACIEQGLVPVLEMITTGFSVTNPSKSSSGNDSGNTYVIVFPEREIRESAQILLILMSSHFSMQSTLSAQVRQKIVQSLTYSGSELLKKNILLSLLYLCGRSNQLGQLMLHKGFDSSLKTNFPIASSATVDDLRISLHAVFQKQSQDSDTILQIMKHFLTQSVSDHMQLLFDVKSHTTKGTSTNRPKSAPLKRLSEVEIRSLPVILRVVDAQSHNDGVVRSIRMTCPSVDKIEKFFPELSRSVEAIQKMQYGCLMQAYDMSLNVTSETVHKLLSSLPDDYFEVLYGAYDIWQEIFSHVSDGYVRESSLAKMSRTALLQCLETAMKYQASPLLIYAYCSYLSMHVQDSTLLETLKVGVVYYDEVISLNSSTEQADCPARQHTFHLALIKACVDYALENSNLRRMMRDQKILPPRLAMEFWQCLQRVLFEIAS